MGIYSTVVDPIQLQYHSIYPFTILHGKKKDHYKGLVQGIYRTILTVHNLSDNNDEFNIYIYYNEDIIDHSSENPTARYTSHLLPQSAKTISSNELLANQYFDSETESPSLPLSNAYGAQLLVPNTSFLYVQLTITMLDG